jgi:eukaryotic-like serine/threonine-protein kinase
MKISATTWNTISKLLDEALDLEPVARTAWLERLQISDPEIATSVQQLLAAHATSETADVLASLPSIENLTGTSSGQKSQLGLSAGDRVGPYLLKRELGAGGMADVWLAERADGAFARDVALKLPRINRLRKDLAIRFARERDILARLEHPHIARLYDAGVTDDGLPYLAMEFVDGQPITNYCDNQRMPIKARLELFAQVLDAVQFAHANLIIHRDLKPSNIIVGNDGRVRLLDFGIAKLLVDDESIAETQLTQLSGRALTPDYASPEQIKGEPLTIATDVYSLGVVLYELLTGNRPYKLKVKSAAQLEMAILEVESLALSSNTADSAAASRSATLRQLTRSLAGDLDMITLKTLAKAPQDRYGTIAALADDLQRFQSGRAVMATAPSRWYRTSKFVLRNKAVIGAASVVTIALIIAAIVSTWQANVAKAQVQLAQQALARQEAVRRLYVEMLSTVATWDVQTFSQPRSVMILLQKRLQELEQEYGERPQELLAIMNAVSVQLNYAGDFEGSLAVAQKYLSLLKTTRADVRTIVYAHLTVARALEHLGRFDESEKVSREAVVWAPHESDRAAQQSRAYAAADLGRVLTRNGKRQEAEKVLSDAEKIAARLFPVDVDRATILHTTSRINLGFDDAAALRFARRGHSVITTVGSADTTLQAESLSSLGTALLANGQLAEAITALRDAHRRCLDLFGQADRDTVTNLGRLAAAYSRQENSAMARQLLSESKERLREATGPEADAALVMVRGRQLDNEIQFGDIKSAAPFAINMDLAMLNQPTIRDADVYLTQQAKWLIWSGRADEAIQRLKAAQEVLKPGARLGPTGFRISAAIAESQLALRQNEAAHATALSLIAAMLNAGATRTWTYRAVTELAAQAQARLGDGVSALRMIDELDAVVEKPTPPSSMDRAESSLRRAPIFLSAGRSNDAAAAISSAVADLRSQHESSPRLTEAKQLASAIEKQK